MNFATISKKQILMLIVALIIAAAIPLTVFISQKQQELRQRAAPNPTKFFYTNLNGSPIDNFSTPVKIAYSFKLFLLPKIAINGFDITVSGDNNLRIKSFAVAAGEFNQPLFTNNLDPTSNTIRFSKVSDDTTKVINSQVLLGTINVMPVDNAIADTKGTITITNSSITSSLQPTGYVEVDTQSLTLPYTISALPPTPTPTPISYRKDGDSTSVPNISLPPGQSITLSFQGVTLPGISSNVQSIALKLAFIGGTNFQQISGAPVIANITRQVVNPATGTATGTVPFSGTVSFSASDVRLSAGDYFIKIRADSYQAKTRGQQGARTDAEIGLQGLTDLIPLKIFVSSTGTQSIIPAVTLAPGDIDGNGVINGADYSMLIACFGSKNIFTSATGATDCGRKTQNGLFNADINKDGKVAGDDINLLWKSVNGTL